MGDLALLGVIHTYVASYLSSNQMIVVLIVGLSVIPVAFVLSRPPMGQTHQGFRMKLDHLEGELKGGKLEIGKWTPSGAIGIDANEKSHIRKVDGVTVASENMPVTGLSTKGEAIVDEATNIIVRQKKRRFWGIFG